MAEALALVAPGRPLRDGLERILLAKRGALIVIGDDAAVLSICTGGFLFDAEFSPQRLSELAKMDGAIILSDDGTRIARANVHLMPKPSIPTTETGTRHRTAERVARSVDVPVVSVSQAMGTITVYRGDSRHALQPAGRLHERVSQALQTLQRFRQRFDLAVTALSVLEVEDTVTFRDVAAVLQPAELVRRIADEVEIALVELGADGRLLRLQLDELTEGVDQVRRLVVRDYVAPPRPVSETAHGQRNGADGAGAAGRSGSDGHRRPAAGRAGNHADGRHADASSATNHGRRPSEPRSAEQALDELARLDTDELLDWRRVAAALGRTEAELDADSPVEPRGYRLLHRLPRFPEVVLDRIVEHFAGLQRIMRASVQELEEVGGVGESRARSVKDGLARLAESNILDRYS
jgi:diadenylate cyclase